MSTFVIVGNAKQKFDRLLNEVNRLVRKLPQPVVVQHGNTPFANSACETHAFFGRERFSELISSASLIICHAGAGCVIETLRSGKIPVVMARLRKFDEVIDDHQVEFADALRKAGRAIVVERQQDFDDLLLDIASVQSLRHRDAIAVPVVTLVRDSLRHVAAKKRGRSQP